MKEIKILPIIIGALTGMCVAQSITIAKNKGEEQIVTEVITSTSEKIVKTGEEIISVADKDIVAGDTILFYRGDTYLKL